MATMNGKIVLITGATNGLGEVTAREIAKMGATVVIVGRNPEKTAHVAADIKTATGNDKVDTIIGDLSIMDGVRHVAQSFRDRYDELHILVNNAGALFTDRQITADGYEKTFALNHLNYFLLTHLLLDTLKATGTPDEKARIVNVSSDAHQMASIDWDDLQNSKSYGTGMAAYGESKLENILFTYELARRLDAEGANVTANALHPGLVSTGFGRNNGFLSKLFMNLLKPFALNADQGAETQIYLATSPEVEGVTGTYFAKSKPATSNEASHKQADWERLWTISEELTGLKTGEPV